MQLRKLALWNNKEINKNARGRPEACDRESYESLPAVCAER